MSTIAKVIPHDNVPGEAATPTPRKEMSPKAKARLAGALFLVTIVGGIFAQGYLSDARGNFISTASSQQSGSRNRADLLRRKHRAAGTSDDSRNVSSARAGHS
jgi:hypothetical protein